MSRLLELFQGKTCNSPPLWFMRQAGRYLPEYRKIRNTCDTFLDLCFSPTLAKEVTLQPLRRFDLDAAILFSDILTIPYALGQNVLFEKNQGPLLSPLTLSSFEEVLSFHNAPKALLSTYETLHLLRAELSPTKALFGFAGAPWTLALYMLEGKGTRDFSKAKEEAFRQEQTFSAFLDFLAQVISFHLIEQIKAGATILQLFDSWAGLCPASHFQKWILRPTQKIVSSVKKEFPHIPFVGFPKGIGASLLEYGQKCGFSGLSLDSSVPLSWAAQNLPQELILQGNLDPLILTVGGDTLKNAIHKIHEEMNKRPYIFNLGHGILPHTPIENAKDCVEWVHALK